METLQTGYTLLGCVDGCIHRLPDIIEEEIRQPERGEKYLAVITTPDCARISECAARRLEIYTRADTNKDKIYLTLTSKNVSSKSAWRRACKAWTVITSEYRDKPCPFFEK